MKKRTVLQPKFIKVINSKKRTLEVDFNYNRCQVTVGAEFDYTSIDLNEAEARRLHKALSQFINLRDYLKNEC